jgi:hypothetical protein
MGIKYPIPEGKGASMKARWKQIQFFLSIVFRELPHSEITGGRFWPRNAWMLSRPIYYFWKVKEPK